MHEYAKKNYRLTIRVEIQDPLIEKIEYSKHKNTHNECLEIIERSNLNNLECFRILEFRNFTFFFAIFPKSDTSRKTKTISKSEYLSASL